MPPGRDGVFCDPTATREVEGGDGGATSSQTRKPRIRDPIAVPEVQIGDGGASSS